MSRCAKIRQDSRRDAAVEWCDNLRAVEIEPGLIERQPGDRTRPFKCVALRRQEGQLVFQRLHGQALSEHGPLLRLDGGRGEPATLRQLALTARLAFCKVQRLAFDGARGFGIGIEFGEVRDTVADIRLGLRDRQPESLRADKRDLLTGPDGAAPNEPGMKLDDAP